MARGALSVKGLKETQDFFDDKHKNVKNEVRAAIEDGLNVIAKDALSAAPVYTGALKGSLQPGAQDNIFRVLDTSDGVRGDYGTQLEAAAHIMGENRSGELGRPQFIRVQPPRTKKAMAFEKNTGEEVITKTVTFDQSSKRAGNWTFIGGRAVNLFLYRAFQKNINGIVKKLKEAVRNS